LVQGKNAGAEGLVPMSKPSLLIHESTIWSIRSVVAMFCGMAEKSLAAIS
jgi:hypothetical protein